MKKIIEKLNSKYIFLVVSILLMGLGCQNSSKYEKEGQTINIQEKCIQIANKEVSSLDFKIKEYNIKFEETEQGYRVVYLPKALQLGGGVEVIIDEKDFTVKDVIYHQ